MRLILGESQMSQIAQWGIAGFIEQPPESGPNFYCKHSQLGYLRWQCLMQTLEMPLMCPKYILKRHTEAAQFHKFITQTGKI